MNWCAHAFRWCRSLCLMLTLWGCAPGSERRATGAPDAPVSVAIETFSIRDSVPPGWSVDAFADSLEARLSQAAGVRPSRPSLLGGDADITLRGDIGARPARVIVSAELRRRGESAPFWSSSYWRDADSLSQAVEAVAGGVAEAVAADQARRRITQMEKRP